MQSESFISVLSDELGIRLYGVPMTDLTITASARQANDPPPVGYVATSAVGFARIYGMSARGGCHRFVKPLILLLPTSAQSPAQACPEFPPDQYAMWSLQADHPVVSIETGTRSVSELATLLDTFDIRFHDVVLNGTVVSGKLRAHIVVSGFTIVDRDDAFSYDFGGRTCIPIFSWGVVGISACVDLAARQICGTGDYGIDLPWPIGHVGGHFNIACFNF